MGGGWGGGEGVALKKFRFETVWTILYELSRVAKFAVTLARKICDSRSPATSSWNFKAVIDQKGEEGRIESISKSGQRTGGLLLVMKLLLQSFRIKEAQDTNVLGHMNQDGP